LLRSAKTIFWLLGQHTSPRDVLPRQNARTPHFISCTL
jgi:hypothetical protein